MSYLKYTGRRNKIKDSIKASSDWCSQWLAPSQSKGKERIVLFYNRENVYLHHEQWMSYAPPCTVELYNSVMDDLLKVLIINNKMTGKSACHSRTMILCMLN